ncbi:MAG: Rieske (2Fe-2S) protein [Actinomycetota bacterium]
MDQFATVAKVVDIKDGDLASFEVAGNRVAIANVGGSFYGFGDVCTHMGCSLSEGELEETTVTCPCHGSQFDVTTGAVRRPPAREPVSAYPVRVQGDAIQVQV